MEDGTPSTVGQQLTQAAVVTECWNSPYGTAYFAEYAEVVEGAHPGPSSLAMSAMAREAGIYLVGGSIPERAITMGPPSPPSRLHNTCTVWDPKGKRIATHRKVHLFDIDIPGSVTFQESAILTPGNALTHFDTPWGRVGLGICYDMRFPELAMIAARRGCIAMIYPGAFNLTTGPLHVWRGASACAEWLLILALCISH